MITVLEQLADSPSPTTLAKRFDEKMQIAKEKYGL
jgi:hypothetical protein